jgi:hypothetical protein
MFPFGGPYLFVVTAVDMPMVKIKPEGFEKEVWINARTIKRLSLVADE